MIALRCTRNLFRILTLMALLTGLSATAQTVGRVSLPASGLPDPLRQAVEAKGYHVPLDKSAAADFFFAKDLATSKKDVAGALYPELSDGEFVGVVQFAQPFTDFRGQSISAGLYSLRYQLLPQDGNHLGVAPNPDFLLAIPATADSHPEESYPYKKLVALSAKSTGGNHPAVIALQNPAEPGTVAKTDSGTIFSVAVPSASATEKMGICLTCSASQ